MVEITDEMVEKAAQLIFKHWQFQPGTPVYWVPSGNSDKQNEARAYARAALSAVLPDAIAQARKDALLDMANRPICEEVK